jgi:NAD(P)-dependent dehydrogenase (short-subunit alcohol dehydrogenase family)
MANEVSKAVLITGCSTGIGRATAELLAGKGWNVYASARRPESIADLEGKGCKIVTLDVTSEESMRTAVESVASAEGAIGVLINNAGYSQSGAVEDVPMDDVRRQFETNVFGLARMCQLVLPGMRRQGWGRIVNISSIGGKLVFPGGGYYHGTKHAVEAISDALRWEVKGFGVDVVIVEPGLIKTEFSNAAVGSINPEMAAEGPYADFNNAVAAETQGAYEGPMAKLGGGPETVARAIEKAISRRRPKTRYKVTPSAHMSLGMRGMVTDRMWDRMMHSQFPAPGKK